MLFLEKIGNTHQYNTKDFCIIRFKMNIPYPIKKELGEGASATTYLIDYNGQEAVLKWPHSRSTLFGKEVLYIYNYIY